MHIPASVALLVQCNAAQCRFWTHGAAQHTYPSTHPTHCAAVSTGSLKYPYLVPAGYYQQMWDWDSMLTGTALLSIGSAPYLAGSMKNFLDHTNLTTGMVKGCLTPGGVYPAIYHAKPVVIQGALIAARAQSDFEQFRTFLPAMRALDGYWERTSRDPATSLFAWHDQLESGCDNLVTSECPSSYVEHLAPVLMAFSFDRVALLHCTGWMRRMVGVNGCVVFLGKHSPAG
jgi:hypothetical protein